MKRFSLAMVFALGVSGCASKPASKPAEYIAVTVQEMDSTLLAIIRHTKRRIIEAMTCGDSDLFDAYTHLQQEFNAIERKLKEQGVFVDEEASLAMTELTATDKAFVHQCGSLYLRALPATPSAK